MEKEKEKRQKEDERKAKELEKEKQKEEKLMKEEMEKKKKEKVKAAFVGFFKQKSVNLDTSKKDEEIMEPQKETYFMPFQVMLNKIYNFYNLTFSGPTKWYHPILIAC